MRAPGKSQRTRPLDARNHQRCLAVRSQEGRVVFAAQTISQLIFGSPIDVNAGTVTGAIRRLRDDATDTGRASLSEDGRVMVFPKYEFASGGVWARDLSTGREWQLAATPRTPLNPVVTVDGRWTAYTISKTDTGGGGGPGDGYVVETAGGAPRKVCAQCQMDQWTRDGRFAVVSEAEHHRLESTGDCDRQTCSAPGGRCRDRSRAI